MSKALTALEAFNPSSLEVFPNTSSAHPICSHGPDDFHIMASLIGNANKPLPVLLHFHKGRAIHGGDLLGVEGVEQDKTKTSAVSGLPCLELSSQDLKLQIFKGSNSPTSNFAFTRKGNVNVLQEEGISVRISGNGRNVTPATIVLTKIS